MTGARAVGGHLPWERAPAAVHGWVEDLIGPVAEATTQPGGMSPGCVVRLRGVGGERVFVKAVGAELNERTTAMFRHEAAVLRLLPAAGHRPALVDTFDDGAWVGLALEDVDGRYPDLDDPADARAVRAMLVRQAAELAPIRPDIPALADTAREWLGTWRRNPVRTVQPAWLAARHAEFDVRVSTLPDRLPPDQLCHWDVRDDNLLVRPDGDVVLFDWGMSRLGPPWVDLLFLALSYAESARFDRDVAAIATELGAGPDPATVDDLLVLFGTRLAWTATHQPTPGIPALTAFKHREARRLFTAAYRRLG